MIWEVGPVLAALGAPDVARRNAELRELAFENARNHPLAVVKEAVRTGWHDLTDQDFRYAARANDAGNAGAVVARYFGADAAARAIANIREPTPGRLRLVGSNSSGGLAERIRRRRYRPRAGVAIGTVSVCSAFGGLAVPIAAVAISAAAVPRYVVPYEVVGFLSTAWLVQLWMVHRFDARSVESVAVGDTTDAPRERSPVVPRATDPGQSAADRNP